MVADTASPLPVFGDMNPLMEKQGMFGDIWDTPQVLRRLLHKHMPSSSNENIGVAPGNCSEGGGYGGAVETPMATPHVGTSAACVDFPQLAKPFPEGHRFGGRSPLEIMKACSLGPSNKLSNRIIIVGSGTSYHASLLGEYVIETLARIPVEVQYASEFKHKGQPLLQNGDVFIVVSNSGETFDAVETLRLVKRSSNGAGVLTVGIVNAADSTLSRESDVFLDVLAEKEAGTASTKAFSGTSLTFVLLAMALGDACETIAKSERDVLIEKIKLLPDQVQTILDRESKSIMQGSRQQTLNVGQCRLWDISCRNVLAQNFIFLGRGFNFPIALEGAMKCKEISYVHAEGYPAAEMKHGPIALIDQFMPVVFIAPQSDPTYEKIRANIEEVKSRSGEIIVITEDGNTELAAMCEFTICVPNTHEFLMPLLAVIPLQLLSFMMGILRGNDVDEPRCLRKTLSSDDVKKDS
eukprot:TRINITY_DN45207_c0_g1_i1.p1 TRINITY_DN45207_c0_g1~~TRINITY_DN45207_c0_g1_i1.p1  ORF type:complete len:488 (+),score=77.34 TRINITY_DN45207_c0_g1_i1:69-1466(+)